jgi:hypothetical protein
LEQLVEQLHDHHRLRAIQDDLRRERTTNGQDLVTNAHNWRWEMAELTFYQWLATLSDQSIA